MLLIILEAARVISFYSCTTSGFLIFHTYFIDTIVKNVAMVVRTQKISCYPGYNILHSGSNADYCNCRVLCEQEACEEKERYQSLLLMILNFYTLIIEVKFI